MGNNAILKYQGGLLQSVGNAVGITNKLLNIDFRKIKAIHFDDHILYIKGVKLALKPLLPNLDIKDFTSGHDAMSYIENCYKKKEKLDLIITGLIQPEFDGFSFAKAVRAIQKKYNTITPILIISMCVSAEGEPSIKKASQDGLWNLAISKTSDGEEIYGCIKSLIDDPHLIIKYEGNLDLDINSLTQGEKEILTLFL